MILLSSITAPASAISVEQGFDCWPSKSDYEIGETVIIFTKTPAAKLPMAMYLLVLKPDGSSVRVDLGTVQRETQPFGIGQAGPPLGQRTVELWGRYEGQWYLKAYCFYSVIYVPPFDFSLSVEPSSQTIKQGESATFRVRVASLTDPVQTPVQTVRLSLSGYHETMRYDFDPSSGLGPHPQGGTITAFTSTLTITTSTSTPIGTYALTITGSDGRTRSASVTISVQRSSPKVTVRCANVVSGGLPQRILREGLLKPLLEFLGQEKFPLLVNDIYITMKDTTRDIESVTLVLWNNSTAEVFVPLEIKASRHQEGVYYTRVAGTSLLSQKDRERAVVLLVFNLISFGVTSKVTDPKVRQTVQNILYCLERKGSGTKALERAINPNIYLGRIDIRYADGQVFQAPPSIVTPLLPLRLETFVDGLKREFEGPQIETLINELIEKLRGQVKAFLGCSTADLLVKTPSGKKIGTQSGREVNEVTGAYYDAKTSLVLVPVEEGTYTIQLYGRSSGSYDLFVWSMSSESAFQTTSQIEPGKTHEYRSSVSVMGKVSVSKEQDWGATIVLLIAIVGGAAACLLLASLVRRPKTPSRAVRRQRACTGPESIRACPTCHHVASQNSRDGKWYCPRCRLSVGR